MWITTLWTSRRGSLTRSRASVTGELALKQWSQYEFILYVKQRYQVFRMLPRDLPVEEYEYHLDDD